MTLAIEHSIADRAAPRRRLRAFAGAAAGARCRPLAAMVVCVGGWSLMWAQALSILHIVPIWVAAAVFLAGLAMIPFCRLSQPT